MRIIALFTDSSKPQILARQLADRGAAHQLHIALQFSLHEAKRALDAGLSGRSQRIEIVAADADRLGADRESLQDVGPALHAAVHEHIDAIAHGVDNFSELIERCARAVELPPTVVGDDDAGTV